MPRKTIKESKPPTVKEIPETIPENTSSETPWTFRWMCNKDIPAIEKIEMQCFESDVWGASMFLRRDNVGGVCCDPISGKVVGYVVYRIKKQSLELVRIAVAPEYHRRGVGTVMVKKLYSKLAKGRTSVVTEVPEQMLSMQLLLRSTGFKATRILKNSDPDADSSYLMVRSQC